MSNGRNIDVATNDGCLQEAVFSFDLYNDSGGIKEINDWLEKHSKYIHVINKSQSCSNGSIIISYTYRQRKDYPWITKKKEITEPLEHAVPLPPKKEKQRKKKYIWF